ncbi:hypothetical protein [Vibrio phage VP4B]|uniref:Uncharacterized protein n=1 Tax=Vibrio phage VP4B TaxID=1262540 RepID=V9LZK0_9CAUD|nr:hypothetical protein FDJ61_gp140 [Vibrio phage VP4B]AGB07254.1 hypothetical protein [Vibrio phage VP4B]
MNLAALAGAVFGTGITYASTESTGLTILSAAAGLATTVILEDKENEYSGPGDFTKAACASLAPILLHREEPEPIPFSFDEEDEDFDILDMPLYFD